MDQKYIALHYKQLKYLPKSLNILLLFQYSIGSPICPVMLFCVLTCGKVVYSLFHTLF